jgi:allantoinase
MSQIIVCTGKRVLLAGSEDPIPATLVIHHDSGKIIDIQQRYHTRDSFESASTISSWVDAGDLVVLPGLVE